MTATPNRRAPGLLLAWVLLDASMGIYLGLNGPSTLSRIALAGGIGLLLFVLVHRPARSAQPTLMGAEFGIGILLAMELLARTLIPFRPEPPAPTVPVQFLAAIALVAVGLWLALRVADLRQSTRGSSARRLPNAVIGGATLAVVIVAALGARFSIIAWDVEPGFDVHLIQEAAGRAVLAAQNPYLTYVYDSGYPYWPLSALLAAAGLVVGDARWGLLVADAAIVGAFIVIARNVGAPGRLGALAAALLLWNSSGLYMTWQSMPEPAVIAFAAAGVAALTRPRSRGRLAGAALGMAIATKQLGLGLLPFLLLSRRSHNRTALVVAGLVSGIIVGALMALNPSAFLEGSLTSLLVEPARGYAINLLDPLPGIVQRFTVPIAVVAIVALGTGLLVRLRWPDSLDGWLAASIALLTVAFALIGISFVNYYQIPLALLLVLVLVPDGWNVEPG